ncbi:MAG: thioesterase family protein [Solirubrobacteraceae bacterium]|nr:thioesterase family protein [Solirubrobacteraceae bacterium]MCU0313599.1 thioesterase family protein [Solirubrobacteraceae bacterium]
MSAEPIFLADGDAFRATAHARGPWDAGAQHGGAPAALLARAIERTEPGSGMLVARITYEFLGPVPLGAALRASTRVVRPGRRFQLIEAELSGDERPLVRARAVRLRRGAVDLPPEALAPASAAPGPELGTPGVFPEDGEPEGFHRTALEIRFVAGTDYGTGPGCAWFRLRRPVVEGEVPTPLQRVAAAADFGNGVSHALPFSGWLFVNTDLSLHLFREPAGEWVLLDARTSVHPVGAGLASATLSDESGPLGSAAQTLFVDRRSSRA